MSYILWVSISAAYTHQYFVSMNMLRAPMEEQKTCM